MLTKSKTFISSLLSVMLIVSQASFSSIFSMEVSKTVVNDNPQTLSTEDSTELDISKGNITISDTDYTIGDSTVSTSNKNYIITNSSGEETSNTIKITSTNKTFNITLQDLNMSSQSSPITAINSSINLILSGKNTLTHTAIKKNQYTPLHCISALSSSLIISGNGTLNVTGCDNGIYAGQLTVNSGTIIAQVTDNSNSTNKNAIFAKNMTINGGNITVNKSFNHGISASENLEIFDGNIKVVQTREGSPVGNSHGIYCQKNMSISGGNINVNANNWWKYLCIQNLTFTYRRVSFPINYKLRTKGFFSNIYIR